MNHDTNTALVTGATSGLGFEAALHLANDGYGRVIVTGRTVEKARRVAAELADRAGRNAFVPLALDLNDSESVAAANRSLAEDGHEISSLILNAGMVSGSELVITDEAVEVTFASSLIGHHRFAIGLLTDELLAPEARLVIAGSEAARNDVPTFTTVDLPSFAVKNFDGDLVAAAVSIIRHDGPLKYKPATAYATAKLFVAWWAAALSERLPYGMTVNAVSPGSAPDTDAGRNANFFMRNVMMPVMKLAPRRLGLAATVPDAARRYVDALDFGPDVSGRFYASAPKKMTGPLHRVDLDHIADRRSQEAAWEATVLVADGLTYPVVADQIDGSPTSASI